MFNIVAKAVILGDRFFHPEEYQFFKIWGHLSFPHRPTENEMAIYREFIGVIPPEAQLLILGATPELRDLAASLELKPVVADISAAMLAGMLGYAKLVKPTNEIWIKDNWLSMPLPERHFDTVIGDLSLRHISPEMQDKLLMKIKELLKPEGKLIIRHHPINPFWSNHSYKEILNDVSDFSFFNEKKYEAMGVLLSRLLDKSTKDQKTNYGEIIEILESYIDKKKSKFFYSLFLQEFLMKRLYPLTKQLTSQTKEEFENLIKKYFLTERIQHDGGYPESEFYPIYLLTLPTRQSR